MRGARSITFLCLLALATACGSEVTSEVDRGAGASSGTDGMAGLHGEHLLSVSTVIAPTLPFVFRAQAASQNGATQLTITPLGYADRTTPVDGPTVHGPFSHDGNGLFVATIASDASGEANPVSFNPIVYELELTVERTTDLPCGTITGTINASGAEIDITGSTFTLVPVAETALPDVHMACDGELAPLPTPPP